VGFRLTGNWLRLLSFRIILGLLRHNFIRNLHLAQIVHIHYFVVC